jgi:hypothetical protein
MTRKGYFRFVARVLCLCLVLVALVSFASAAWKEKVLYSFQGGSDGATPAGGVAFDKKGNLYGATTDGGSSCPSPGCGTVFQLAPPTQKGGAWTETILHGFSGSDGSQPAGSVIVDANGNLFGTTAYGGSGTCILLGSNVGCGIVYELSPPARQGGKWTYTAVYNFQGGKDGQYPRGDLVFDSTGNLYGATVYGGGYGTCNAPYFLYCGTVFKLNPPKKKGGQWREKVLHAFKSGTDGSNPNGGLVFDSKGAIYGTTYAGGNQNCKTDSSVGCGTAFELKPPSTKGGDWAENHLHIFTAVSDGRLPSSGVIFDASGAIYGAAEGGVKMGGVVFRLATAGGGGWKETVVYGFSSGSYSYTPVVAVFDRIGNLYGTTNVGPSQSLAGSVFRLRPPKRNDGSWSFTLLYGFTGVPDATLPNAGLVFDETGNLYGTTELGGTGACQGGCGTVLEVNP